MYEFVYIVKGQEERSRWCVNINVGIIIILFPFSFFSFPLSFLFLLIYTSYIPNYNLLRISNETTILSSVSVPMILTCKFSFFPSWFVSLSLQLVSLLFVLALGFAVFAFSSSTHPHPRSGIWMRKEKKRESFLLPILFLFPLSSFSLQMHELNSILFVLNVQNDNQMSFSSLSSSLPTLSLPTFHRKKLESKKRRIDRNREKKRKREHSCCCYIFWFCTRGGLRMHTSSSIPRSLLLLPSRLGERGREGGCAYGKEGEKMRKKEGERERNWREKGL